MSIPRVTLAPGYTVSRIVKGGWQLAGGHGAVDSLGALDDMRRFVDAGVTTFDCADIYTGVERLIGEFLQRLRAERGTEAARQVQVHTKYVPDLADLASLSRDAVERAIDRSLRRLGVEALDLVQFHWWDFDVPGYLDAAGWLADLARAGKIRHLGGTNFDTARLAALVDAGIPIITHQVQYSVVDQRPAGDHAAWCAAHGIRLLCYGALAGGLVSARYFGGTEPRPPFENRSLAKYGLVIDEWGGWPLFQDLLRTLTAIGAPHGVGPGAIALAWVLHQFDVASVIVGVRHAGHLDDLRAAATLRLGAGDLARLRAIQERSGGPRGDVYALEREKHGRHAAIMRYDLNSRQAEDR